MRGGKDSAEVCLGRSRNGLITENPVFIMALGLCPTSIVTTSMVNAIGMRLSPLVASMFSNLIISVLSGMISGRVRPPAEAVIVAPLMMTMRLSIQDFAPSIRTVLGTYIPLIVVNCIILGRVEAYTLGAKPISTLFDGLGMGPGFTLTLLLFGSFRKIIGTDSIFGIKLIPDAYHISIFVLPPGTFFAMASPVAGMQYYQDDKHGRKNRLIPLEEAETEVVKPVTKPATATVAAQIIVAIIAVEAENPATEKKEEVK